MNKDTESLGPLHELLIRGLPDFVSNGSLEVKTKLAPHFGISYQAVYKWFERERVSAKRMQALIALSNASINKPSTMVVDGKEVPWRPLDVKDFIPFVG